MYFLSLALFALNIFILDGLGGYVLNKRHFSDLLFVSVDERICIFGNFYDVIWLNLIFKIINILISEFSSNCTLRVDFSLQEDSILDDLAILFLPVFIKILSVHKALNGILRVKLWSGTKDVFSLFSAQD